MSKHGYLTSEEYVAICQYLGMGTEDLVKFHKVQNRSTISRWQTGKSFVSELACDKITELFRQISERVNAALAVIYSTNKDECQTVMIIYPESCANMVFGLSQSGWPLPAYNAYIRHVYAEATAKGYNIGLIKFNPQSYFAYCAANNLKDSPESRSSWAATVYETISPEKSLAQE